MLWNIHKDHHVLFASKVDVLSTSVPPSKVIIEEEKFDMQEVIHKILYSFLMNAIDKQYTSPINLHMMLEFLSSMEFSEDKKVDSSHADCEAEGFNENSKSWSDMELLELFHVSIGFGPNPRVITTTNITMPSAILPTDPISRSVRTKEPEQLSPAQLTTFYMEIKNGYEMTVEKVEAIMMLPSASTWSNQRTSTIRSKGKIEQILLQLSNHALNAVNENQPQRQAADLEKVWKLSVKRFLQKRTERFNRVAPYTTTEAAKAGNMQTTRSHFR